MSADAPSPGGAASAQRNRLSALDAEIAVRAKKPPAALARFSAARSEGRMSRAKPRAVQSNTNGNSERDLGDAQEAAACAARNRSGTKLAACHVRSRNPAVCPPPATRHAMQPAMRTRRWRNSGTARRYPSLSPRRAKTRRSPRRRSGIPRLPGEAAPGERDSRAAPCRARRRKRALAKPARRRPSPDRGAKPSSG